MDPAAQGEATLLSFIDAASAGDRGAAEGLVRRLLPIVRARVKRVLSRASGGRGPGPSEVDDLTQEVWVRLLKDQARQLRSFDPTRGVSLEGFVGMIAEREATNGLRKASAAKRGGGSKRADEAAALAIPAAKTDPENRVISEDLARALAAYLEKELPERGLLVLRAVHEDGKRPEEAAQALGVNVQVVYNWLHRIRALTRSFVTETA